jgi:hypothetical protein
MLYDPVAGPYKVIVPRTRKNIIVPPDNKMVTVDEVSEETSAPGRGLSRWSNHFRYIPVCVMSHTVYFRQTWTLIALHW